MILSKAELGEFYEQVVKPKYFSPKPSTENPSCVFLSGQPGCGKTNLREAARITFDNKAGVLIDQDLIREDHPKFHDIDPKDRVRLLRDDVIEIRKMLYEDCIKAKKNIIMEGTFSWKNDENEAMMKQMKEGNMKVTLAALSVHETVSKIGIYSRYFDQLKDTGTARYVNIDSHDYMYHTIPENIKSAINKGLVDEIKIFGREELSKRPKIPKLITTFTNEQIKYDPERPIMAYHQERGRPFTKGEHLKYVEWAANVAKKAVQFNYSVKEFQSDLLKTRGKNTEEQKIQISQIAKSGDINEIIKKQELDKVKLHFQDSDFTAEKATVKGIIINDAQIRTTADGSKLLEYTVGIDLPGQQKMKFETVQAWNIVAVEHPEQLKKNDLIEIKGLPKTKIEGDKPVRNYINATEVVCYKPVLELPLEKKLINPEIKKPELKNSVTIEARIISDPKSKDVVKKTGENQKLIDFKAMHKVGKDVKTTTFTVYAEDFKTTKADELRKGDSVKFTGHPTVGRTKSGETIEGFTVKAAEIIKKGEDLNRGQKIN